MDKEQVIACLKDADLDIQSANAAILAADLVYRSYSNSDKLHGVNFSPVFAYFSYDKPSPFHQIIQKSFIVEVNEKNYEEYKSDKKSLDKKISEHQSITNELDSFWSEYNIARNNSSLDKEKLIVFYNRIEEITERWWHYGVIGEDKGAIIERKIVPNLAKRKKISIEEAQELISILSHPKEQAIFNLERKEFLGICLEILQKGSSEEIGEGAMFSLKKDENLVSKIESYIKNYFWVKTDFYKVKEINTQSIIKDALSEIKGKNKEGLREEIKKIDDSFKKIEEQKKEILKKNNLTQEDKDDIYFALRIIYWMDQRKVGMMKNFYYFFTLLSDIGVFWGIDYDELALYTLKEIEELLTNNIKVNDSILKNRHKNALMLLERRKSPQFFYGETGREMFEIATLVEKEEVKGIVASKGTGEEFIEGNVNVVLDPNGKDFKEGEILVTSMTRVEYVPLMRKAKAIITNEGGLACHAAIVSRELGIPAIIGTKNATHILKDGDVVSVNIKKGLITKK